eukprot:sb/3472758/
MSYRKIMSKSSPHSGRKSVGFKPGGLSLAAGVKGAKNISEAPLMHVSNLDHHERVSSYDSVESAVSNNSVSLNIFVKIYITVGPRFSGTPRMPLNRGPTETVLIGGRSSDNSAPFVGPLGTRPIKQPARVTPPKHQLHIDSSSREQSSYNQDEVGMLIRDI